MKHDISLYILDDDNEVTEYTGKDKFMFWANWMEKTQRRIAHDEFDDVEVSTMFLGIDQWTCLDAPPKPFETKVWKAGVWIDVTRSETWDKALEAHKNAVHCEWIKGVDFYDKKFYC